VRRAGIGAALLLALCLPAPPSHAEVPGATSDRLHPAMIDAFGDTLRAGPCPRRIVSLSPNVTEVLFALGVDSSRLVGVTSFCDYPPAARRRPIVGGIVDPSPEAIAIQRPDLVLAVRGNPRPVLGQLRRLGLPVFAFDDRTPLRGVAELMATAAALTCPDDSVRAAAVVLGFRGVLAAYESWVAAIPAAERPTVYYADPEFPTWTAGAGSHIDDLIRLAGGANLAGALPGWPQVSLERILLDQPRYLLLSVPGGSEPERVYRDLMSRPGWSNLAALRERRICWVPAPSLQRPGPRLAGVLAELAACLHPERVLPNGKDAVAPRAPRLRTPIPPAPRRQAPVPDSAGVR
jgi:iron complex transport system substrate-binding protein